MGWTSSLQNASSATYFGTSRLKSTGRTFCPRLDLPSWVYTCKWLTSYPAYCNLRRPARRRGEARISREFPFTCGRGSPDRSCQRYPQGKCPLYDCSTPSRCWPRKQIRYQYRLIEDNSTCTCVSFTYAAAYAALPIMCESYTGASLNVSERVDAVAQGMRHEC